METFVQLISGGLEMQDPLSSLTQPHSLTASHFPLFISLSLSAPVFLQAEYNMHFLDYSEDREVKESGGIALLSLWVWSFHSKKRKREKKLLSSEEVSWLTLN